MHAGQKRVTSFFATCFPLFIVPSVIPAQQLKPTLRTTRDRKVSANSSVTIAGEVKIVDEEVEGGKQRSASIETETPSHQQQQQPAEQGPDTSLQVRR